MAGQSTGSDRCPEIRVRRVSFRLTERKKSFCLILRHRPIQRQKNIRLAPQTQQGNDSDRIFCRGFAVSFLTLFSRTGNFGHGKLRQNGENLREHQNLSVYLDDCWYSSTTTDFRVHFYGVTFSRKCRLDQGSIQFRFHRLLSLSRLRF